jgi:hypothetical protein
MWNPVRLNNEVERSLKGNNPYKRLTGMLYGQQSA